MLVSPASLQRAEAPRARDTSYPQAFPMEPPKHNAIAKRSVPSERAPPWTARQAGAALLPQPLAQARSAFLPPGVARRSTLRRYSIDEAGIRSVWVRLHRPPTSAPTT